LDPEETLERVPKIRPLTGDGQEKQTPQGSEVFRKKKKAFGKTLKSGKTVPREKVLCRSEVETKNKKRPSTEKKRKKRSTL